MTKPRQTKARKLSATEIKRVTAALRNYQKQRDTIQVTDELIIIKRPSRKLTTEQKYERAIKRYANPFEDEQDRRNNWSRWSRKTKSGRTTMPKAFDDRAQQINRQRGYDIYSNFGYSVVYYAYTQSTAVDVILKQMTVDKYDGDLYRFMGKA